METHAQSQPRSRKRQRPRVSESVNPAVPASTAATIATQQPWGSGVATASHPTAVRGNSDTVPQPPTSGFPSQQLDRSHQVAEPDSLMNGYSTSQHTQFDNTPSALTPTSQNDPASLGNLTALNSITGDVTSASQHAHAHHLQQSQAQQQLQQLQQQSQQQRASAVAQNKADRVVLQQQFNSSQSAGDTSPATVANSATAPFNLSAWPAAGPGTPSSSMPQQSPVNRTTGLLPPPEGIFRSFDDLLNSIQKIAKDQGYGVVKLRASNYREGKPTRYDLVCDRGGVKYNSTAKKRNPTTRKIDCPWRAKAVCEVNLGNQWRFAVQESRHNHEARMAATAPGNENAPIAQNIRTISHKIDRMSHDIGQNFSQLEASILSRLDGIEKRIQSLETGRDSILGANGVATMSATSMSTANMGGNALGNGSLTNGSMGANALLDSRMNSLEARISTIERSGTMDTLPMMDDETGRLSMMVSS